jgi:hypothetical protein
VYRKPSPHLPRRGKLKGQVHEDERHAVWAAKAGARANIDGGTYATSNWSATLMEACAGNQASAETPTANDNFI